MMYQCGRCGLTRASGQVMGLAMPQCQCPWEFNPPVAQTPPQRTWVGLTNDEVNNFAAGCHLGNSVQGAIYKAEAKLKEKNT